MSYILPPLLALTMQVPADINQAVLKASTKYGIEPQLVYAIITVESNFNRYAVGASHGEIGLMQLHPKYFPKATFEVSNNIDQGVKYLAYVQKLCQPKYGEAWFVCYNVGPNRFLKHPTKHLYYRKVYANYRMRIASGYN